MVVFEAPWRHAARRRPPHKLQLPHSLSTTAHPVAAVIAAVEYYLVRSQRWLHDPDLAEHMKAREVDILAYLPHDFAPRAGQRPVHARHHRGRIRHLAATRVGGAQPAAPSHHAGAGVAGSNFQGLIV